MEIQRKTFKVVYTQDDIFQKQHAADLVVQVAYQPNAPVESWLITAEATPFADTDASIAASMGLVTAEDNGYHLMYQSGTRTVRSLLEAANDVGDKAFGNIQWKKGK